MLALQKMHADEAARHRVEVERVLAEQKKTATEKGFLEFNLAEGNEQIKNLQRAIKEGEKSAISKAETRHNLLSTPKKNKTLPYGDGFDDQEMQVVSPPKLAIRAKAVTPKVGGKRKRKPAESSPVKPLPLRQPANDIQPDEPNEKSNKKFSASTETVRIHDYERYQAC